MCSSDLSPVFINMNRELVSAQVGTESQGLAGLNTSGDAPANTLLPPLELINTPSIPFPSFGMETPFFSSIKGAIGFLEWNGYICQPRSIVTSTQTSSHSTSKESSNEGSSVLNNSGSVSKGKKEGKRSLAVKHRDRKSTRLNSSHSGESRMPSSA